MDMRGDVNPRLFAAVIRLTIIYMSTHVAFFCGVTTPNHLFCYSDDNSGVRSSVAISGRFRPLHPLRHEIPYKQAVDGKCHPYTHIEAIHTVVIGCTAARCHSSL